MLSTKNIAVSYEDVPQTWIFEHYCKLDVKLEGQRENILSVFNDKDKKPSMFIYYDQISSKYKFKDFSSGYSGDGAELVKRLYNLSFKEAAFKIVDDYNLYSKTNRYENKSLQLRENYKVKSYKVRQWNTLDRDFWLKYNIGSSLLNRYNVKPLESYVIGKDDVEMTINPTYIYGYFTNDGELYKIYQPYSKLKFFRVFDYIQGVEQLEGHSKLLITSSLKDIMALKSLKLNIDIVASESENTYFKKEVMESFLERYDGKVSLLFDNDEPGIKAMMKLRELYPVKAFVLPLSKDPSDSIKEFGVKKVLYTLVPLLQRSYE